MTIKRMTFLQELLAYLGLSGRLHLEWISSAEAQKFVQVVTDFTEMIRKLGPNPINMYHQTPTDKGPGMKSGFTRLDVDTIRADELELAGDSG
jgi:F420-non-reducing hydrogenase iron-sulfur subunit